MVSHALMMASVCPMSASAMDPPTPARVGDVAEDGPGALAVLVVIRIDTLVPCDAILPVISMFSQSSVSCPPLAFPPKICTALCLQYRHTLLRIWLDIRGITDRGETRSGLGAIVLPAPCRYYPMDLADNTRGKGNLDPAAASGTGHADPRRTSEA